MKQAFNLQFRVSYLFILLRVLWIFRGATQRVPPRVRFSRPIGGNLKSKLLPSGF